MLNLQPFDFWQPFELVNVAFRFLRKNRIWFSFNPFLILPFTNSQVYSMNHDC